MGITVAVMRAAANTATGTQDFTTADMGGLTPKAALFIVTKAITDGVAANDVVISIGAATGVSNEWSAQGTGEHGVATTNNHNIQEGDRCISVWFADTNAIDGDADFDSFIADGVRVNWQNALGSAYLVTVVLFGGTDLSAIAGFKGLGNSIQTVAITDIGFEADLVITAHARRSIDQDITSNQCCFGAVHNDGAGGVNQRNYIFRWQDNNTAGDPRAQIRSAEGIMQLRANAIVDWVGVFQTFDASGFDVDIQTAGANGIDLLYLALNFGGAAKSFVGPVTSPTSIGNDAQTGPGFKPQFVMMGMSMLEAENSPNLTNLAGSFGVSTFTPTAEFCNSVQSEDAAATTNEQSISDNTAIELPDDDGAAGLTASFVSMDTTGWTLNYSAVEASAKQFWALAIEEVAAAAGGRIMSSLAGPGGLASKGGIAGPGGGLAG